MVTLAREADVDPRIIVYLNRLSDLLFVLARAENQAARHRRGPLVALRPARSTSLQMKRLLRHLSQILPALLALGLAAFVLRSADVSRAMTRCARSGGGCPSSSSRTSP